MNKKIICDSCSSDYADEYFRNKHTDEVICSECLLQLDKVSTSTTTNYYHDGEYIGNDDDSLQDVIDSICTYEDYEKVEG